jgi:hypothetical protein
MRTTTPFRQFIKLLEQLHKEYPSYNMGKHLSTAFSEYGDLWGVSDKELCFAIEKYMTQMEIGYFPDADIEKIIEDGKNLDQMLDDGYEEE